MKLKNPFKITRGQISDPSVRGYNAQHAQGDTVLFLPSLSGWMGKNLKQKHLGVFYVLVHVFFLVLLTRSTQLQAVQGDFYFDKAENNRTKQILLRAPRGLLYDRFGEAIVHNTVFFELTMNPELIKDTVQAASLATEIARILPDDADAVTQKLNTYAGKTSIVKLASNIPYARAIPLMILSADNAALQVEYVPQRVVGAIPGIAHIVGYVGKIDTTEREKNPHYRLDDVIGKSGIEQTYEALLRGGDGSVEVEVDSLGREKGELARRSAQRGSGLVLSIDVDAQRQLFEVVRSASSRNFNKPASGVVLDPRSGEILALVSIPSYDANVFYATGSNLYQELLSNEQKPLFNRVVGGSYPAGSIFKMAVAAAALEEKTISDRYSVLSTGGLRLGDKFFPDWKSGGHGLTNIYKAISDSVNTFFYLVGGGDEETPGLGVDVIIRYAREFGFGSKTGIDVAGETSGFVPSREWKESRGERWYQGDTYNLAIGQGDLLVSPLQVARYVSVFANGGTLITPHIGKSIKNDSGDQPVSYPSRKMQLSPETISIVRTGMRRTITQGTAQSLQSIPVPVAGKTGTAQFSTNKDPHSWFAAFAPYETPEIVIVVQVEEGGDRGLSVEAAREFLNWYFSR